MFNTKLIIKFFAFTLFIAWNLVSTSVFAELPDFRKLVKDNSKIVVNISTIKKATDIPNQFRGIPKEFLPFFFGTPELQPRQREPEQQQSLGSGFIISRDGYIITNHHVIAGADEVYISLQNREKHKAKIIGSDKRTDIALLKIKAKNLPTAKLGNSNNVEVGEWVAAIGSPFGLDYTATKGIISAKKRSLNSDPYVSFIQTDVPINPGNSGGPLFNLKGEVVGVNAQIYSKSGGFMGLSFAIPIETATYVVEQLKKQGEVKRGFLGIQLQEITAELAESFKMKRPTGALVAQVFSNTAAALAGLKEGDIILEYNGIKIEKSGDLPPVVGITPIGTVVKVKILRKGRTITIYPKIKAERDSATVAANGSLYFEKMGIEVSNVSQNELQSLNVQYGVKVTQVKESHARRARIRPGDIITSVNSTAIKNSTTLENVLHKLKSNDTVPIKIVRPNVGSIYIAFTMR